MYRQVGTDTEVSTTCKVALGRAMNSGTLVGVPILFTLIVQNKTNNGGQTTAVANQFRRSHVGSTPERDAVHTCNRHTV